MKKALEKRHGYISLISEDDMRNQLMITLTSSDDDAEVLRLWRQTPCEGAVLVAIVLGRSVELVSAMINQFGQFELGPQLSSIGPIPDKYLPILLQPNAADLMVEYLRGLLSRKLNVSSVIRHLSTIIPQVPANLIQVFPRPSIIHPARLQFFFFEEILKRWDDMASNISICLGKEHSAYFELYLLSLPLDTLIGYLTDRRVFWPGTFLGMVFSVAVKKYGVKIVIIAALEYPNRHYLYLHLLPSYPDQFPSSHFLADLFGKYSADCLLLVRRAAFWGKLPVLGLSSGAVQILYGLAGVENDDREGLSAFMKDAARANKALNDWLELCRPFAEHS